MTVIIRQAGHPEAQPQRAAGLEGPVERMAGPLLDGGQVVGGAGGQEVGAGPETRHVERGQDDAERSGAARRPALTARGGAHRNQTMLSWRSVRAPVAQLDRASASGAEGYRFEPYRAYQHTAPPHLHRPFTSFRKVM